MSLKDAGNAAHKAGNFLDAVEAYTAALDSSPDDPTSAVLCSNRAASLLALGRLGPALSDATRAATLDPSHPRAASRAGSTALRLGVLPTAKPLLEAAAALGADVHDDLALWGKANAYIAAAAPATSAYWNVERSSGRLAPGDAVDDATIQAWAHAVSALPDAPSIRLGQAQALHSQRRFKSAVAAARSAMETAERTHAGADVWDAQAAATTLAHAQAAAGDLSGAAEAASAAGIPVAEALQRVANDKARANDLVRSVCCGLLMRVCVTLPKYKAGAYAEALAAYRAAGEAAAGALGVDLAVFHGNAAAAVTAGGGSPADAEEECTWALKAWPFSAKVLTRRGNIRLAAGNAAGAAEDYIASLYLEPLQPALSNHLATATPPAAITVDSVDDWRRRVADAGPRPIVVDFYADWCGPCKVIAPTFATLSAAYPTAVFLKVDGDTLMDLSAPAGVKAFPTFQVYRGGARVDEVRGADPTSLDAMIKRTLPWPPGVLVDALPKPAHIAVWPPQ